MLNRDHAFSLLRDMQRIREFEQACAEQYSAGNIRGFLHLYIGEEAIAVGVLRHLKRQDSVFCTYREHGHALMRGLTAKSIMAEMFGKVEGCSRGRGGSMHLFDREQNFIGGSAIVGGALPMTVGVALAEKMKGTDYIASCFFGEGAMAEGEFHESLNLAALWDLPALFICENNLYAMGTALERSESQTNLVRKAEVFNLKAASVDGMDVLAVEETARQAIDYVRTEKKPFFLECKTYRFRAHSMFDAELYREKSEVEEWKQKDPIETFKKAMIDEDLINKEDIELIEKEAKEEVAEAIDFANKGQLEDVSDLYRYVYSERKE